MQRKGAVESQAAESRRVAVEEELDESVPPRFGNGHLRGLSVIDICFEECVACLDGF